VVTLALAALAAWWSPYFLNGWLPDSEWAYGLIWGDWISDRLFLVTRHIIPEWNPTYVLGINYIGRDPFNNPLSLGNAFKFFFDDPKKEFVFGIFFFLLIMAVGTYKFLRSQEVSRELAIFGAILIVIYPKWMDDIYHGPGKFVTAYSVLPWFMYVSHRMFQNRPRLIFYIILGLMGAVIFLGSGAWASILVSYLIVPYFLYQNWQYLRKSPEKKWINILRGIAGISLTILISLGLSSYLLLPLWDNLKYSARSAYHPPDGYGLFDFLGLIFPWESRLYTMGYYDLPLILPFGIGIITTYRSYFGILLIPLVIYILFRPELRNKTKFFWIWPLTFLFLFSKVGLTLFPVSRLFEKYLGAQSSENFLFYGFIFCFNLLTVKALSALRTDCERNQTDKLALNNNTLIRNIISILIIFYSLIAIIWIILGIAARNYGSIFQYLLHLYIFKDPKNFLGIQLLFNTYFCSYFFYLILLTYLVRLFILWWVRSRKIVTYRWGFPILFIMMVVDFILFPKLIYPFTSSHELRYSPSLEQNAFVDNVVKKTERIGSNPIYEKYSLKISMFIDLINQKYLPQKIWDPQGLAQDINKINVDKGFWGPLFDPGISYYAVTQGKQIYNYHSSFLPDYFYDFDRAMNGGNSRYLRSSWNAIWDPDSKLIDVAGISYLFWYEPIQNAKLKLVGRYSIGDGYIYNNQAAVSKAYLVSQLEFNPDRADLLRRMQEASFDPRVTVTTEDEEMFNLYHQKIEGSTANPVYAEAAIIEYSPNRIVLDVATDNPAILVVTDLFFPHWTAKVDHQLTKIYRVNCTFRGMIIEPGKHHVLLEFYNQPFHRGLQISFITLCLVLTLLIATGCYKFRRRKQ
jgi:hypothetical protein